MTINRARWKEQIFANASDDAVTGYVECDDGWKDLICDLYDALLATGIAFKVSQVKQKWGGLRFYVDMTDPDADTDRPQKLIEEAEERSFSICEACGAKGEPGGGLCVKTLCPPCRTGKSAPKS